ncbi:MAG: hypothetical protein C0467_17630 [Planctomycetaceae bacterium]|nr:hypothetical protein [Planctomycetaceae bacterium]
MIQVVPDACRKVADYLRRHPIPEDVEDQMLPSVSPELAGNYLFLLVAICHQTTPQGNPPPPPLVGTVAGVSRKGWDYLSAKLQEVVTTSQELLTPSTWATVTGPDLTAIFRDATNGERLSDPEGRAGLVRDMGEKMTAARWTCLHDMQNAVGSRVAELLPALAQFHAYRDPVQKKSLFLLSLMRNSKLWDFPDPESLGPPVDYHEVRGHLRLGTVQVVSDVLEGKLRSQTEVTPEEDLAIRRAVFSAIMRIAEELKVTPSQMHYLFWNIFRTCCKREETHCAACPAGCGLVQRYRPLTVHSVGPASCPFSPVCSSAGQHLKYVEHYHRTDYY